MLNGNVDCGLLFVDAGAWPEADVIGSADLCASSVRVAVLEKAVDVNMATPRLKEWRAS